MNDIPKKNFNDLSRLKWACRRGMLELDVLLGNFLDQAYSALPNHQKEAFIHLLECTDPEIFAWLMGHDIPIDPELQQITEVIRNHVRTSFSN